MFIKLAERITAQYPKEGWEERTTYLNLSRACSISGHPEGGSEIVFGENYAVWVKETPEEILEQVPKGLP